ncbi:Alkyl hydroperoxide reductase subunit F [Methanocorpusculaceae archaeon Sp1]|nr:Alkyl hydroperoxide reductase subunit F [Methanocorpusculaceae archaeon Sp1]
MTHEITVYSLEGCPHCRNLKEFLAKQNVSYTNFDVGKDEAAANRMIELTGQRGVPVTIIDGQIVIGDDLMKVAVLLDAPSPASEVKEIPKDHELIIIGSGAAGLSAAMYAGRKGLETLVIGGAVGGMATKSSSVENYPGFPDIPGDDLMQKFAEHARASGVTIIEDVGLSIRSENGRFVIETLSEKEYTAKSVIAATGRSPRLSGATGEAEYLGKGIAVCTTCDGPLYRGKTVAILGGGNTAMDMAIEMAGIASQVHVISATPLDADSVLIGRLTEMKNVTFHTGFTITEFGGGKLLEYVKMVPVNAGPEQKKGFLANILPSSPEKKLKVDGAFLGVGLDPNTAMFEGFVSMNAEKEIVVDINCKTNVKGLFAAGDSTSISAKQIASSVGEGVKALLSAYDHLRKI